MRIPIDATKTRIFVVLFAVGAHIEHLVNVVSLEFGQTKTQTNIGAAEQ